MKITVPILLVGFNRPHCVRKVMQQLEIIKPQSIYFSIDAPRVGKNEEELVKQVIDIVKNVSWNCKCHYRFHERNVGAEVNVSTAISWVLEEHDYVIVNEDDIYADYSFYKFIQDMLIHYKDDERIGLVTGLNLNPVADKIMDDYYISRDGHIWGWGTWKRVWKNYSLYDEIKEENLSIPLLESYYGEREKAENTREILLKQAERGVGKVTWDYMFWYHRILHNYYAIVPNKNLVTNIGVEGLHASGLALTHFTKRKSDYCVTDFWDFEQARSNEKLYLKPYRKRTIFIKAYDRIKLFVLKTFKYNNKFLTEFYKS